jgi:hypothetical protein
MAQPFKPVPTAVDRWTTEVKAYGVAEVALLSGLALSPPVAQVVRFQGLPVERHRPPAGGQALWEP